MAQGFSHVHKKFAAGFGLRRTGACGRTRTGDLRITNALLYQLSHTSRSVFGCSVLYRKHVPRIRRKKDALLVSGPSAVLRTVGLRHARSGECTD